MNISFRDQAAGFISANQSAVAGTVLFAVAFSVFAINATFNQSGNHPLPLWSKTQNIVTNSVSIPVRRVETIRFSPPNIPIPMLRPGNATRNQAHFQSSKPADFAPALPVDGAKIQNLLAQLGFYSGPVDGMIGSKTKLAIRAFEKSKFLPESGEASPSLLLLLESTIEASLKKTSRLSKIDDTTSANQNPDAAMVTRIQVGLINFGISDVSIDGVMGNQTSHAIKKFQAKFNLKVDGRASSALVEKLESVGALTKG